MCKVHAHIRTIYYVPNLRIKYNQSVEYLEGK
jgi:hypothetical protein